jgi:hypothetical protein
MCPQAIFETDVDDKVKKTLPMIWN